MSTVKRGTKIFSKPLPKRTHGLGGIKIAEAAAELGFLSFAVLYLVNSVGLLLLLYRFGSEREKMGGINDLKGPQQEYDASASLGPVAEPGGTCPATQEGEL